jgi:hypothetical protein
LSGGGYFHGILNISNATASQQTNEIGAHKAGTIIAQVFQFDLAEVGV